jgi:chromate transporter
MQPGKWLQPWAPLTDPVAADRTASPGRTAQSRGTVLEVLRVATGLGLTSFGGPVAHLGYFRREYVERRKWLDERTYAELVGLCQSLPGPASSQLGIAIGTRRAGALGGVAAWVGFTLPSAIALVIFAAFASSVDLADAGWVHGLKIAAVAVVALAVYQMARRLTPDWTRRVMAVIAAAAALLLTTPFAQIAIIGVGAVAGLLILAPPEPTTTDDERSPISRAIGIAALATFFGLVVLLPIARVGDGQVAAMVDAFFRDGALVFGGGHVVLPLLHTSVVDTGWVSNDQFLAGYGAAQAVPGPLFSFAAYLGAIQAPSPNGIPGALIALVAIYLPSFLLIFGTLPFWHWLRRSPSFGKALAGTNAVVVGLLVAALYTPIWTSAITGVLDVVVAAAALTALATGRVPPIVVVVGCAIVGQLMTLVI